MKSEVNISQNQVLNINITWQELRPKIMQETLQKYTKHTNQ